MCKWALTNAHITFLKSKKNTSKQFVCLRCHNHFKVDGSSENKTKDEYMCHWVPASALVLLNTGSHNLAQAGLELNIQSRLEGAVICFLTLLSADITGKNYHSQLLIVSWTFISSLLVAEEGMLRYSCYAQGLSTFFPGFRGALCSTFPYQLHWLSLATPNAIGWVSSVGKGHIMKGENQFSQVSSNPHTNYPLIVTCTPWHPPHTHTAGHVYTHTK